MQQLNYPQHLLSQAANIKLVITDIDGVLTDGKVYLDQGQNELKSFNIKDGLSIKWLLSHGIRVAVITGRTSKIVERRMNELGVNEVYQNQPDKRMCYQSLLDKFKLTEQQVAYLGDDLPDLPLINRSGLGVAVADAHWHLLNKADWITQKKGGEGAFRDLAELILNSKGVLDTILAGYQN